MSQQQIHRRKSSRDEDDNSNATTTVTAALHSPDPSAPTSLNGTIIHNGDSNPNSNTIIDSPPPPRIRVQSSPHFLPSGHNRSASTSFIGASVGLNGGGGQIPSAGPFRTHFPVPRSPGPTLPSSASPFRTSFSSSPLAVPSGGHGGHSRTRSTSSPFAPPSPSPLSNSGFSPPPKPTSPVPTMYAFPAGASVSPGPEDTALPSSPTTTTTTRRHSRIHSRNLSVFFPRPGSLPTATIAEDGAQELEIPNDEENALPIPQANPSISIPSKRNHNHNPPTPLGNGFTFGTKPPPSALEGIEEPDPLSSGRTKRRGHHHKHSMSHNFFSFLEPGSAGLSAAAGGTNGEAELHTQPTPTPMSPWAPISAIVPDSAAPGKSSFGNAQVEAHAHSHTHNHNHSHLPSSPHFPDDAPRIPANAATSGILQFILGGWLWVCGQQIGSLAVTGLGYWVVFDAFGVGLSRVAGPWLASSGGQKNFGEKEREKLRRAYGNGRVETVFAFAQSVYLMFSSVYVCKETVEHLLLSVGGGEGHHHHHGDEDEAIHIEFPIFVIGITFLSILATAILFDNHSKLVDVSGNRIPPLSTIIRSLSSSRPTRHYDSQQPPPTSPLALALSNPYVAAPLFFCLTILFIPLALPATQHRTADLLTAGLIAVVTFNIAYRACVVLGTVLLQTSPPRGMVSGKMEAFLRVMREVERHPQVLHLPAPHIWQLTPSSAYPSSSSSSSSTTSTKSTRESLVVTLELHVREDLGDDDVLALTKWASEKCVAALRGPEKRAHASEGEPEVTIGVVRG